MLDRIYNRLAPFIDGQRIKRLRRRMRSIGTNVELAYGFDCDMPSRVVIGSHVFIGAFAMFTSRGGIRIDDGVNFGPRVRIITANHRYETDEAAPFDGGVILKPVHIGQGAWIGGDVLIVPGVRIGPGAVIAAGSVVTRSIEPGVIAGGVPCREFKRRDMAVFEKLRREGRWFRKLYAGGQMPEHEIGLEEVERVLSGRD